MAKTIFLITENYIYTSFLLKKGMILDLSSSETSV